MLYLCPYQGSGAERDPYRPKYIEDGWSAIDIRSDPTRVDGFCFLWLAKPRIELDLIELGMDANTVLSVQAKIEVSAALRFDVTAITTLGTLLMKLLGDGAADVPKLQAREDTKEQEIYCGDGLWVARRDPTK